MKRADTGADEERWLAAQRNEVLQYLARQPVKFGALGEHSAWFVDPYISLWAVESVAKPGAVGWWVVAGDLPTDYMSSAEGRHPREALAAFAARWREAAACMKRGEPHPEISIGSPENAAELAPLLDTRAQTMAEYARDDANWKN
jgi:hypothetical protein